MAFYSVIKTGHLTDIQYLIRHCPDLKIYSHPFPFFSIFKLVSERKLAEAFSVPFFIYEGNTEVTFHSLLMEPGEKDIKSSDGCGSFPFFFSIFLAPSVMMMKMGHVCLNSCQHDGSSVRGTLLFNLI